jgi:hypothetical protein
MFDAKEFRKHCVWLGGNNRRIKGFLFPSLVKTICEGIVNDRFNTKEKPTQKVPSFLTGLTNPGIHLTVGRVTPWELSPTSMRMRSLRRARSDESLRISTSDLKSPVQRRSQKISRRLDLSLNDVDIPLWAVLPKGDGQMMFTPNAFQDSWSPVRAANRTKRSHKEAQRK